MVRQLYRCPYCLLDLSVSALIIHIEQVHRNWDIMPESCPVCGNELGNGEMIPHLIDGHAQGVVPGTQGLPEDFWIFPSPAASTSKAQEPATGEVPFGSLPPGELQFGSFSLSSLRRSPPPVSSRRLENITHTPRSCSPVPSGNADNLPRTPRFTRVGSNNRNWDKLLTELNKEETSNVPEHRQRSLSEEERTVARARSEFTLELVYSKIFEGDDPGR